MELACRQVKYALFGSVYLQTCSWGVQLTVISTLFLSVLMVSEVMAHTKKLIWLIKNIQRVWVVDKNVLIFFNAQIHLVINVTQSIFRVETFRQEHIGRAPLVQHDQVILQ